MQDDKKLIFNSFDTVKLCLLVMIELMEKMKFNKLEMKNTVDKSYSTATDLANWLVKNLKYSYPINHDIENMFLMLFYVIFHNFFVRV